MRHFSTLSKRVEFSTRGGEPGKVQVERSGTVGKEERGGEGRRGDRGLALALLSRLFFIAMVSRVSLRGWLGKGGGGEGWRRSGDEIKI